MSNLNKVDVPIAVTHKTKLDLSCSHITTGTFMRLQPVLYRHCIAKESLDLDVSSIIRPAPIECPVFGDLRQNIRAFFVPYRLVFPNWCEFYEDTIASNSQYNSLVSRVPQIANSELVAMFLNPAAGLAQLENTTIDFYYGGNTYKYTAKGRRFLKILESLGYKVIFASRSDSLVYNALGILSLLRVYIDWYANSQYLNSAEVLAFERVCKFNDPTTNLSILSGDLFTFLTLVDTVIYDNEDYYTNAWDNPVAPVTGQYTAFSFADPTVTGGAVVRSSANGTPEMLQTSNTSVSIGTTYIHEALKRLTDFQKRHSLAGARSIDRFLAQYGIVTDYLKQNRSIYIGSAVNNIEIGSIYATADSTNGATSSSTGDYSGAGYGKGGGHFSFSPDEEGMFIVISSIIPAGDLVQGYDRNNLHLDKFDFFVPEFDGLGVQALEKGEVYISPDEAFAVDSIDYQGVFGFTGRYGEYKRPKSFVTGDLRYQLHSLNLGGAPSWYLNRLFDDNTFTNMSGLVHSLDFTRGLDAGQYNRIFQYLGTDFEQFYIFMKFQFVSHSPCKPLFETYEFEDGGKKVATENGSKVN